MNYRKKGLIWGAAAVSILLITLGSYSLVNRTTYKQAENGLLYRIVRKGKGPKPTSGQTMLVRIKCETALKKTIFDTNEYGFPSAINYDELLKYREEGNKDPDNQQPAILPSAIMMLEHTGDSLTFQVDAEPFFRESFNNFDEIKKLYNLSQKDPKVYLHLELIDTMTEEQFNKWAAEQQQKLQKQQEAKIAAKIAQAAQQTEQDIKVIQQYLQENNLKAEKTVSGLHYIIETPGKGAQPKPGDKVKVNYTGYLLNGKVFDTSLEAAAKKHNIHNPQRPYAPFEFQVGAGQVIQGWDEAMQLLSKGTRAKLLIPSPLAYGDRAVGEDISANAVLVFDVELVDIEPQQ